MHRTALSSVLVALLLVLAGCSGGTQVSSTSSTSTPSTTRPTTATAHVSAPPGASNQRIENASRLVDADLARLDETSYRATLEANSTLGNRTISSEFSFAVSRNATRYRQESDYTSTTMYRRDGTWFQRTEGNTSSRTLVTDADAASLTQTTPTDIQRSLLGVLLAVADYERNGTVTRDGQTLARYTASGVNETKLEEQASGSTNVTRYDASVLVDADGVVHELSATIVSNTPGQESRSEYHYTLHALGGVTVRTPDWYGSVPHLTLDAVGDGDVLALRNHGGAPLPAGTALTIATTGTGTRVQLDDPVDPAETVYLTATKRGDQVSVSLHNATPPAGNLTFTATGVRLFGTPPGDSGVLVRLSVPGNRSASTAARSAPRRPSIPSVPGR